MGRRLDSPRHGDDRRAGLLPRRALPTEIYADPSLPEKVEVAITVACEAMMPVINDRVPIDPDHPEPLTCDVALACAGRIHAVVQCTKSGPVVIRFADLWPSMV